MVTTSSIKVYTKEVRQSPESFLAEPGTNLHCEQGVLGEEPGDPGVPWDLGGGWWHWRSSRQ